MKINRVVLWIFYLFSFTISINQYLSTRLLVLLAVVSLFLKGISGAKLLNNGWVFILYLFVLISGLLYSSDPTTGLAVLETSFPLFAIPLIISKISLYESDLFKNSVWAFISGLLLASLFSIGMALNNYWNEGHVESFYYYSLTETIGYHPTYFAYYLIFAITYILYSLYYKNTELYTFPSGIILAFFFVILLFTGGNTAFISLLLIFSFFLLKFLLEKRDVSKIYLLTGIIVMLIVLFILQATETSLPNTEPLNDSWERITIWESTVKAIPNPFFGVGTGDYKAVMNDYFLRHGMNDFARNNMNAHNQILQLFLSNGILGVISFVLMLAVPLYRGVKTQSMQMVITLFPFIVYGMTEVFLNRYQGVVFFAWLVQIQLFDLQREKPSLKL